MAGIYIHIPYCKKACHYCDFHFSTNLKNREEMVGTIVREINLRQDYLADKPIESIYFGGGTPSILRQNEIKKILDTINETFDMKNPEVTLESNPDDLSESVLNGFYEVGVNRLSIGIQTFENDRLDFLNRSHNSEQAGQSFNWARMAGFNNISADLIFAIPSESKSFSRFESDLYKLIEYDPEHISLYNLTIESKTVFGNWLTKNKLTPVSEESCARQFELAIELLATAGYEHYEVSNFAKPERYSRHNSSYWKSSLYLGVGPGAHS
ncbi:MAG: radical SAM family heme chaperone HemW, partial [Cytophagales bacterium]|nr:radical SAM family heme chaperone HemW [Cytophagales bacterium]